MVLKFDRKPLKSKRAVVIDSSEDEFAIGMSSDDAFSNPSAQPTRRSTRSGVTSANDRDLPFSPKKTRSRRIITVHSSGSEFEDSMDSSSRSPSPKKRSTRSRKRVVKNLDEDSDDGEWYSPGPSKAKTAKKKGKSKRTSRPAYGVFRSVKVLDEEKEEEDAALRAHRNLCEKCLGAPAHILHAAYQKKMKRANGRKRKNNDDEEDEEDDIEALGGWVRW